MTHLRTMIAGFLLFALQACGSATPPIVVTPDIAFAGVDHAAQALVGTYQNTDFTPLHTLPTNDSASYGGYLGATIYNNQDNRVTRVVGQADITLSFAASFITAAGSIDGFVDETQGAMQGTLYLSNATLDRDGDPDVDPTFVAQATGVLRWPSLLSRSIDIVLEGDLRTAQHTALAGEVLGHHTASGGNGRVVGSFVLER